MYVPFSISGYTFHILLFSGCVVFRCFHGLWWVSMAEMREKRLRGIKTDLLQHGIPQIFSITPLAASQIGREGCYKFDCSVI